jgi:FkbM family methyltransferase
VIKKLIKNTRPFSWIYLIYHTELDFIRKKRNVKKINREESVQFERVQPWFKANGDETLRLDYDLNQDSIVFDVGGYKGEFARDIFCKYQCTIFVFEPIPEFYRIARHRFCSNTKVTLYNFGLSSQTQTSLIGVMDNSSSTVSMGTEALEISLVSIIDFMSHNKFYVVDLLKLNIEGGEYELLESLISNNYLRRFRNIQVQFHDFVIPDAKCRMENIQRKLSETHRLTYQFEFVWENWELKAEYL